MHVSTVARCAGGDDLPSWVGVEERKGKSESELSLGAFWQRCSQSEKSGARSSKWPLFLLPTGKLQALDEIGGGGVLIFVCVSCQRWRRSHITTLRGESWISPMLMHVIRHPCEYYNQKVFISICPWGLLHDVFTTSEDYLE